MSKTFGIAFTVGAALAPSVSNVFSTVEQKIKSSASRMEALTARAKAFKAVADADARRKEMGRLFAASGGRDPMVKEQLFKAQAAYSKARAAAEKYGAAVGGYAAAHAKATAEIAKTESALGRLNAQKQLQDKRQELRGRMLDSVAPVMSMAMPLKSAIDFESSMADVAKTIDSMRDDNGNLTKDYYKMEAVIKKMGREMPLTHEQLAGIFAAGGQMGIEKVDELQEFATMATHMSVAFGMSTEQAADAIGGYKTKLNLTNDETRDMLDLINKFANTSAATEKDVAGIVSRVGALGDVAGISVKPMTAMAATLASMKIPEEIAATGLKNFMLAMSKGDAATKSQKAAFAAIGVDSKQLAIHMQKDAEGAMLKVLEKIQKLPKYQQTAILTEMFGSESVGAIAPMLTRLDLLKKNFLLAADKTKYAGACQQEYENRTKTTANSLILLKNRVNELGINLGSVLLPPLVTVVGIIGSGISAVAEFAAEHKTLTTAVMGVAIGYTAFKTGALAAAYGSTFFSGALIKLPSLIRVVGVVTQAAFGPIGIAAAGLALVAGYIVQNWETVGPFFTGLWEDITSGVSDLGASFGVAIDTVIITPLRTLISLCETAYEWVTTLPKVGDSIKSVGDKVSNFVGDGVSGLKKAFGFGEAKTEKTEAVLPEQTADEFVGPREIAGPFLPQKSIVPVRKTASQRQTEQDAKAAEKREREARQKPAPQRPPASVAQSASVNTGFTFNLNGIPDADMARRVVAAMNDKKPDIERLISDIVNNQMRLAYGK